MFPLPTKIITPVDAVGRGTLGPVCEGLVDREELETEIVGRAGLVVVVEEVVAGGRLDDERSVYDVVHVGETEDVDESGVGWVGSVVLSSQSI